MRAGQKFLLLLFELLFRILLIKNAVFFVAQVNAANTVRASDTVGAEVEIIRIFTIVGVEDLLCANEP